ncbi:UDP-glucose dehydrogenase family protein [Sulfuracidifex metallicus]|uniref:UDP-glucose 6-dehydrogenase n=1 Tax=Sulfuracidifex metallicus DSM 6482 = JCM 9184 TaxID=523847 RepID=A0A6A9QNW2_SULME|nr:UDP-glucose/GDP-mannose dehydrogenase family protein [Sulfuracidifex metallicus]MUN28975.1 nucleotide sugar dehydrogenase [Sulfuracidifex metallicus DSM 6482 = JCM 9184]WOE50520.1 UDP-glucose/GDP-mannose dehydrogenase family protein [Sulfuracidifex metallicus DSM 6482 = JCM 9184]
MKIGIIGLGYVGLVTSAVLADQGHLVVGVDVDSKRVEGLSCGRNPIYEPGLDELLAKNKDRLQFTTDYAKLSDVDVAFISVSTPTVNGEIYLEYVMSASKSLAKVLRKDSLIVMKSTVLPGTSRKVREITGREVVSNPEFLKEGSAIKDSINPDRVVIGSYTKEAGDVVESIWKFTGAPIVRTTPEEAEMIKYAANSFLAMKVSFINEIANLCERIPNCDVNKIAEGIGLDKRISPHFLKAGLGWGGSCFPKDTLAISTFARSLGTPLRTVDASIQVNNERPKRAVTLLKEIMGQLKGRKVCVLGVAFKADTDDTRESVALKVIDILKEEGAQVVAYDPKAKANVTMVSMEQCIDESEGVIIATEWNHFKGIEDKLRGKYVVDGRRLLDPSKMDLTKFRAIGLGTPSIQGE